MQACGNRFTCRTSDASDSNMLMVDAQQNISTDGGIALVFTNGTGSGPLDDVSTGMGLFFNHFADGKWHHMAGSLSAYVGLTVSYVLAGFHQDAALGTFDLYLANAAILHANGSITPILTGQSGLSVAAFSGTQCGAVPDEFRITGGRHDRRSDQHDFLFGRPSGDNPDGAERRRLAGLGGDLLTLRGPSWRTGPP